MADNDARVNAEEFAQVLDAAMGALDSVVDEDWSKPAGTLEWTCWQTVDHTVDCLLSYAMQVAAKAQSGFLPFRELHAEADASAEDLLVGLRGVGSMFLAVVRLAPSETVASDGVLLLDLSDWCARAAYELGLHTHDVLNGLGATLQLPGDLCNSIVASPSLWMLDRVRASAASDPWTGLLIGSGRPVEN
jgi:hypothetical protein